LNKLVPTGQKADWRAGVAMAPIPAMKEHPVTLHVWDDLRRSRLTVFFRPLLALPHIVWLYLWTVVVEFVVFLNWFVALITGRPAKSFQRFVAAYLRYVTTVAAYMIYVANPFPGFVGERGSYPVELELPTTPEKQSRWKTFFRYFLAYPAFLIAGISFFPLYFLFFPIIGFAWWATMITGRIPRGFRDLGANALRYVGQVWAYLFLITGRYPNSSPYVGMSFEAPTAAAVPAAAEAATAEAAEVQAAMKMFDDAYIVRDNPELYEAVTKALDSVYASQNGLMTLLDRLYAGVVIFGGHIQLAHWGDMAWNELLKKREIVRCLQRAKDERAVDKLRELLQAECSDAQWREIVRPALSEAVNAISTPSET
jgi:hypothetical protein